MKGFKLAAAVAFMSGIAVAYAAERTVGQKGKVFSEKEVTLKKGDTIVFVNDDNIAHNVMSTSAASKFNLGLIQPGHSTPVTFKNSGEVQVICAIHPTMKMTVKVAD
ncbi:MAG: hypothetical protein FJX62_21425 [Alphaproteobacteria bacterium]|nr:hypothetical protein [Alphaproteobacteria bacterium]